MLGALGGGNPRRAALPALWRDGKVLAAPHLRVGPAVPELQFRALGGGIDAVFRPLTKMRHSPRANVTYVS